MTRFFKSVSLCLTLFAGLNLAVPSLSLAECQGGKDGKKCHCKKDKNKSKRGNTKKSSEESSETKTVTPSES